MTAALRAGAIVGAVSSQEHGYGAVAFRWRKAKLSTYPWFLPSFQDNKIVQFLAAIFPRYLVES